MADRAMGTDGTDRAGAKAQEAVKEAASEVRDRGEHMVEVGKEKVRELGGRASEAARSRGDEQLDRVADGARTVADALREGSRELPQERQQYEAFIGTVADRVEDVARYLRDQDVDSLTREARRVARDHTPLFLSGAFTLGLLGARFLKSTGDTGRGDTYEGDGPSERWSPEGEGRRTPETSLGQGRSATDVGEGGGYAV